MSKLKKRKSDLSSLHEINKKRNKKNELTEKQKLAGSIDGLIPIIDKEKKLIRYKKIVK